MLALRPPSTLTAVWGQGHVWLCPAWASLAMPTAQRGGDPIALRQPVPLAPSQRRRGDTEEEGTVGGMAGCTASCACIRRAGAMLGGLSQGSPPAVASPQPLSPCPRASLWSSCVVLPLLALTWMSAVLAMTDRRSILFQVLFAVFNSVQGFVIITVHGFLRREVGWPWKGTEVGGPLATGP